MTQYRVKYLVLSMGYTDVEADTPQQAVDIASDHDFDDCLDLVELDPYRVLELPPGYPDVQGSEPIDTGWRRQVSFTAEMERMMEQE